MLLRFNIASMREELRIGGNVSPLSAPTDIFVDGDCAVVSSSGDKKLIKIDLNSYTVKDYKEFEEPVYSYKKVRGFELVLLESGLYLL